MVDATCSRSIRGPSPVKGQFDFTDRAKRIRGTKKTTTEGTPMTTTLSEGEYWKQHVKNGADAMTFYKIFYPHYPDALKRACVLRLESLVDNVNKGEPTEADVELLQSMDDAREKEKRLKWDPYEDLKKEKHEALMNIAVKRMDDLLAETPSQDSKTSAR